MDPEDNDLPVSLADARASLELITAMYYSSETGAPVTLPIAADHPRYESWLPQSSGLRSDLQSDLKAKVQS